MQTDPEKLLKKHEQLVHSDMVKVTSHVQREKGDWFLNALMIEGCEIPFKYKRTKKYKNLQGQRVNLTYYPGTESVAGLEFEVMNVVRIRIA
ncbi:MAG: hypothetical protein BMS9Abin33_1090 [Gammaproteobacteria bacterium]|nr:MAG: hypothetical protein BMS9Abin33_1090 [Gammaproteobacteria bacterium]